jgi:hypothetical protein
MPRRGKEGRWVEWSCSSMSSYAAAAREADIRVVPMSTLGSVACETRS